MISSIWSDSGIKYRAPRTLSCLDLDLLSKWCVKCAYWFLQFVCAASTNQIWRCCWMISHIDRFKYLALHWGWISSCSIISQCLYLFIFWCCLSVKDDLKWYQIRWGENETEYEHEHCLIKNWGWNQYNKGWENRPEIVNSRCNYCGFLALISVDLLHKVKSPIATFFLCFSRSIHFWSDHFSALFCRKSI